VDSFDRPHYLLTLPIVRLVYPGGVESVTIFFVMSGYVCSIKPIKLARAGNIENARAAIASSALRRFFRLAGPALFSTVLSWFLDSIGAFNTVREYIPPDHFAIRERPSSVLASLKQLFHSVVEIHHSH